MSLLRDALLVAVTAVIVAIFVPAYLKPSLPVPEIFGTVAPGFEEVREVFRRNYEDGWDNREAGSAFAAFHEGKKVVDLWAGYADLEAKRLWREDTLSIIFSATKGLAAVCIAMLIDRGRLDPNKTVAHYWPEFAQNGKENITIEQLIEHEAGLYITSEKLSYGLLRDHDALDKVLARTPPAWEPGSAHGYHGITMGPYVDALIRRVDEKKRNIGKFFQEEIQIPFAQEIDAFIGSPKDTSYRFGRCIFKKATWSHVLYAILNRDSYRKSMIGSLVGSNEHHKKMVDNCGELCDFRRLADPHIREIDMASVYGAATARGVAKLFGILANGGRYGNKTLLSEPTIDQYVSDRRGLVPDKVWFGFLSRWKYGMDIIPQPNDEGNFFGASGRGGQIGYADPNNKIGYGFISRYMSPMGPQFHDPRIKNLQESVLRAVKKIRE